MGIPETKMAETRGLNCSCYSKKYVFFMGLAGARLDTTDVAKFQLGKKPAQQKTVSRFKELQAIIKTMYQLHNTQTYDLFPHGLFVNSAASRSRSRKHLTKLMHPQAHVN